MKLRFDSLSLYEDGMRWDEMECEYEWRKE